MAKTTPEGEVKKLCKALFKRVGAYRAMIVTMGMGESGHPDFLVCLHGVLLGVETKATSDDHPTELQKKRLREIRAAGGRTFVVDIDNFAAFEWVILSVHNYVMTSMQSISRMIHKPIGEMRPYVHYNPLVLSGQAWQDLHASTASGRAPLALP